MIPDDGLTAEQREALAKSRFQTLQLLRFTGVLLMVIGMWVWAGDILVDGGWPLGGGVVFAIGAFEALLLPTLLAKRWRGGPRP